MKVLKTLLLIFAFVALLAVSGVCAYLLYILTQHFQYMIEHELFPHAYYLMVMIVICAMLMVSIWASMVQYLFTYGLHDTGEGSNDGRKTIR